MPTSMSPFCIFIFMKHVNLLCKLNAHLSVPILYGLKCKSMNEVALFNKWACLSSSKWEHYIQLSLTEKFKQLTTHSH